MVAFCPLRVSCLTIEVGLELSNFEFLKVGLELSNFLFWNCRCGNVAAILELDEHLQREFTIFEAAPQVCD